MNGKKIILLVTFFLILIILIYLEQNIYIQNEINANIF